LHHHLKTFFYKLCEKQIVNFSKILKYELFKNNGFPNTMQEKLFFLVFCVVVFCKIALLSSNLQGLTA